MFARVLLTIHRTPNPFLFLCLCSFTFNFLAAASVCEMSYSICFLGTCTRRMMSWHYWFLRLFHGGSILFLFSYFDCFSFVFLCGIFLFWWFFLWNATRKKGIFMLTFVILQVLFCFFTLPRDKNWNEIGHHFFLRFIFRFALLWLQQQNLFDIGDIFVWRTFFVFIPHVLVFI